MQLKKIIAAAVVALTLVVGVTAAQSAPRKQPPGFSVRPGTPPGLNDLPFIPPGVLRDGKDNPPGTVPVGTIPRPVSAR